MNDTANPIVIGFLFVLRCLIPLAVLFGTSYLLKRLELVIEHADEEAKSEEDLEKSSMIGENKEADEKNSQFASKQKKQAASKKKKPASKKKKEA